MIALIIICIVIVIAAPALALAHKIYRAVFYNTDEMKARPYKIPDGEQYAPYADHIRDLLSVIEAAPFEPVTIRSVDGLRLYGRYFHIKDGGPLHIQFHGYHGAAVREFGGCMQCEWELGCNTLLVDQRAHGKSGGNITAFGIRERYDCVSWAEYAAGRFGPQTPILLSGVSMGATSVLMASDLQLPASVAGIIADSPYDYPRDIICEVIRQKKLPVNLVWPLLYWGGRIFASVDLKSASALSSVSRTKLPILIYHGSGDRLVPCRMSEKIRRANPDCVQLEIFPGAAHGISYLSDEERYVKIMRDYIERVTGK
ncbi:MAG: alpha/beta hydrolase [Anaerovoracaceae bacterium]|jgi:pimeloyl-ACP methyl ester carboxylesterase